MLMQVSRTFIWVRVGDATEYQAFDDLEEAVEYLNELGVGRVDHWRSGGFATVNYWGRAYIAVYRGDADANLVSNLLPDERVVVEDGLQECEGPKGQSDRRRVSSEGRPLGTAENGPRFRYRRCG
jgi:hypothetical protein